MSLSFSDIGFRFPVMPGSCDAVVDLFEYEYYINDSLQFSELCEKPEEELTEIELRAMDNWAWRALILWSLRRKDICNWTSNDFRKYNIMTSDVDLFRSEQDFHMYMDEFPTAIDVGYKFPALPRDVPISCAAICLYRAKTASDDHVWTLLDYKYSENRNIRIKIATYLCNTLDSTLANSEVTDKELLELLYSDIDLTASRDYLEKILKVIDL